MPDPVVDVVPAPADASSFSAAASQEAFAQAIPPLAEKPTIGILGPDGSVVSSVRVVGDKGKASAAGVPEASAGKAPDATDPADATAATPDAVDPAAASFAAGASPAPGSADAGDLAPGGSTPGPTEVSPPPDPVQEQIKEDREFLATLTPKEQFGTLLKVSKGTIERGLANGVFDTPEKKALAEAALADINDSSSVLAALKIAHEAAVAAGLENAPLIEANMEDVATFIMVSHNGKDQSLSDLMVERKTADAARQAEIDEIINNGTRTAEFKIVPNKYEGKKPEEIDGMALDDSIAFLEKRIKDAKDKDPKSDTSDDEQMLAAAKAAKNAKGYRAMFTVGTIRALQNHFAGVEGAEELILPPEVMATLAPAEQAAIKELLGDLYRYSGVEEARGKAILELGNNGDFTELMKHPALRAMQIVNKLYGQEFKNQDDANKYVDKALKLLEDEKYGRLKKGGKAVGGFAVLMLLLANALKEGVGTAIGPGQ